jgi:hypothetical protein
MIKIYFRVTFNMVMNHSEADSDKLSLKTTDLTNANEITKEEKLYLANCACQVLTL